MLQICPHMKRQTSIKNSWAEKCKNRRFEQKKRYALFDPFYACFIHIDLTTFLFKTEGSRYLPDERCNADAGNVHYVKSDQF